MEEVVGRDMTTTAALLPQMSSIHARTLYVCIGEWTGRCYLHTGLGIGKDGLDGRLRRERL